MSYNNKMLKLNQRLQRSTEDLKSIILNHQHHIPQLLTHQQLISLHFTLESHIHVPFFIKYVFTHRTPTPSEINILQQYSHHNLNPTINHIEPLIHNLIQLSQKQHTLSSYVQAIHHHLIQSSLKEADILLKYDIVNFQHCRELLSFLMHPSEDKEVSSLLKATLSQLLVNALQQISNNHVQIIDLYLQCVAILLNLHFTTASSQILLSIVHSSMAKFPQLIAKIIEKQYKMMKSSMDNVWVSRALFQLFRECFSNELYFLGVGQMVMNKSIEQLLTLGDAFYKMLRQLIEFEHLGWVAILGMREWINSSIKEQHICHCISFIREIYYDQQHIITEILVILIKMHIHHFPINITILLNNLSHHQLHYLTLELQHTLSPSQQLTLIQQANQLLALTPHTPIAHLAHYLTLQIQSKGDQQIMKMIEEVKQKMNQRMQQIDYNSVAKCTATLQDISLLKLNTDNYKSKASLPILLNYFRPLLLNDFYSQQYWLTRQKMNIFTPPKVNHHHGQTLDILFQFVEEQKCQNLSFIMLLTYLLGKERSHIKSLPQQHMKILERYVNFSAVSLKGEVFISNILIILQFYHILAQLPLPTAILHSIASTIHQSHISTFFTTLIYSKLDYFTQSSMLYILERQVTLDFNYQPYLPFFTKTQSNTCYPINQDINNIYQLYQRTTTLQLNPHYTIRQLKARLHVASNLTTNCQPLHLLNFIQQISQSFTFQSPIFKNEIVVLTYLQNSPEDAYYYKNHFICLLHLEYVKTFMLAAEKMKDKEMNLAIYNSCGYLLKEILEGNTLSHGLEFYRSLIKSQILYTLLTQNILSAFSTVQIRHLITLALQIISKDNYPLLRQYVEVTLCRLYVALNLQQRREVRASLLNQMKVNLNIGIPIALILGYELLLWCQFPSKLKQQWRQIDAIHEILIKFISSHTAYLRAICQYYLLKYLQHIKTEDAFLNNIIPFWMQDKDSQKILTNIAMVIDGFKSAVENQHDFLGFQRVQEYPSNRLKLFIYQQLGRFYSDCIINEFIPQKDVDASLTEALNAAAQQRYERLRVQYLQELESYLKDEQSRVLKSNMKKRQQKVKPVVVVKVDKKVAGKQKRGTIKKEQVKQRLIMKQDTIFHKYQQFFEFTNIGSSYSTQTAPDIIVIATLLQKVHNFGHILRTLHHKNAMIVVPSNQPLMHPQCKELIPPHCDVQIVEIRQRDLLKFIKLMKSLGYPLVALEQCSQSVRVEEAKFPQRLMVLLGNERLGAPSKLLGEGDLLVQIGQIGKIRSLNVHVSMVICLWQYLSK